MDFESISLRFIANDGVAESLGFLLMAITKSYQIFLQSDLNLLLSSIMYEASSFHMPSSVLGSIQNFKIFSFDDSKVMSYCLICISLVTNEFEDFLCIHFHFSCDSYSSACPFSFSLICKSFLFLRY